MKLFLPFFILYVLTAGAQKKTSHTIFTASGKKVSYEKMLQVVEEKDIILFGELHNNPIAHWLQLELTKDLNEKVNLILGAEMFEADNQEVLNKYLKDEINGKELDSMARLWKNYKTDYAPLVDYAKEKKLPFIASNIPRRYASLVYKNGFEILDTLNEYEKKWMAPLPIPFDPDLPTYRHILKMMGDHGSADLVKAQAIKDATMAHFILKNHSTGNVFLHFNGSYHSNFYEGILWYLKKEMPDLNYTTIATVSQSDPNKLLEENFNMADFIICVDEDMTSTY